MATSLESGDSATIGSTRMSFYSETVHALRAAYLRGKLRSVEARRHQLKRLIDMVQDNRESFVAALKKDLHKPAFETDLAEVMFVLNEARHAYNELSTWVKPEQVRKLRGRRVVGGGGAARFGKFFAKEVKKLKWLVKSFDSKRCLWREFSVLKEP